MSTRRLRPEDWKPVHPTKITIRNSREPRDERPRIPGPAQRTRPTPINIAPGQMIPLLRAPQPTDKPEVELSESLRDPEVVDLAGPNTWPRRAPQFPRQNPRRMPSPSSSSQYSTRQSEVSFGILDYYMDREPPPTPNLVSNYPRLDTPIIDPAIDKFDFGLVPSPPKSPLLYQGDQVVLNQKESDAHQGAERLGTGLPASPPSTPPLDLQIVKHGPYSLFPRIKDTTPTSRQGSGSLDFPSSQGSTPTNNIMFVPYVHPDPSYRPRKESMSSSVRSRKDSFTSFSGTRRIPMRILSSESTVTPKTLSTGSNSTSTASPPYQSRWSDDTITSPTVATTPGLRMSFGSLFGRENGQYPACFFEDDDDDDEVIPLRRRLLWKRSINLTPEQRAMKAGRFDERRSFGRRVASVMLCGGCCGRI